MRAEHAATAWRPAWWGPRARRALEFGFLLLVLALLVRLAQGLDWAGACSALQSLPLTTLAAAALLAAASFVLYSSFDLIGRRQTGHRLPPQRVMAVAFTSYAFNLNLGALVGGIGLRYRLYSRHGLDVGVVTQVLALSLLTNWLGYLALGGLVLLFRPPALPAGWNLGWGADVVGTLLLLAVAGYVAACFAAARSGWKPRWRGRSLVLPGGRIALLQLAMSMLNWSLIGAVCWVLLQQRVDYPTVLGTLLLAAVAGVVTHVPAGLGVLEAVFVALLAPWLPQGQVLGALLAYRALYYLLPLLLACALFWRIDRGSGSV